jgi:hypothetical protein
MVVEKERSDELSFQNVQQLHDLNILCPISSCGSEIVKKLLFVDLEKTRKRREAGARTPPIFFMTNTKLEGSKTQFEIFKSSSNRSELYFKYFALDKLRWW